MVDAAIQLIVEGGLGAVTLAAVGERSGYSRGLASARFGSKAGLIEAVISAVNTGWRERALKPAHSEASALLAASTFVESLCDEVEEDDSNLRALFIMMYESVVADPVVRTRSAQMQVELIDNLAECFRRGVADGTIRADIDPDAEASLFVAGMRGIGFDWMINPAGSDPIAGLKLVRAAMVDRIATDAGRASL